MADMMTHQSFEGAGFVTGEVIDMHRGTLCPTIYREVDELFKGHSYAKAIYSKFKWPEKQTKRG